MLFPFGFGLSYTTYAYSGLSVTPGENVTVSFRVKNTGKSSGIEIAQIYASLPDAAGEPPKRLVGWTRVALGPGEQKDVTVKVDLPMISVFNAEKNLWEVVPGEYKIRAGGSSRDLPLSATIALSGK